MVMHTQHTFCNLPLGLEIEPLEPIISENMPPKERRTDQHLIPVNSSCCKAVKNCCNAHWGRGISNSMNNIMHS